MSGGKTSLFAHFSPKGPGWADGHQVRANVGGSQVGLAVMGCRSTQS